jgi:hypothetical protein
MVKKSLPNAKDWKNRDIDDWTTTTFRQYLADQHEAKYGIKYTTRNFAIEARWLKSMIAEHGPEIVKAFIDGCFAEYKPTRDYPGLNFAFMFSYQRARILPRVMAEAKRRQVIEESKKQAVVQDENLDEWL